MKKGLKNSFQQNRVKKTPKISDQISTDTNSVNNPPVNQMKKTPGGRKCVQMDNTQFNATSTSLRETSTIDLGRASANFSSPTSTHVRHK